MVVSKVIDGVTTVLEGVWDAGERLTGDRVIRLGVTGLARSGKTVFITSLVSNLLDRGRMPGLVAAREGRIEAAYLRPQPDDTVPRFEYEAHLAALTGPDPHWPDSTRSISQLRLSLRVRPTGLLAGLQSAQTVHLDIVDYPGEWLLDLGLLEKSFEDWSQEVIARAQTRSEGEQFRNALASLKAEQSFDEAVALQLSASFTAYLQAARGAGYSDCTPGRFLLPGDLAGSPVLTFAPLPGGEAPRGSLRREMARRFEAYKAQVVRPFFRDHFSRIDRQVVLVDALGAIHAGPQAVADLRHALSDTLAAFRPGQNAFLSQIFRGRRVERILFAATKADHIHHSQHPQLTAIMSALVRDASDRAQFAGAETQAMALASLRATTEEMRTHDGAEIGVVRGRRAGDHAPVAFYPGALPEDPAHLLTPVMQGKTSWLDADYSVMKFAPAPLALKPGDGPPHLRLDRAAEFLIGDRL